MARQVLPLVGAVAGFAVGGPTGAQIGFALGSLVGNAVDPIEMQGRKLGDSPVQTASEGGARAIVYGKGCIRATCIIERGGRRVIKQRDSSGGKGGGPTTINERALWTFAIGLGEPVAGLLRIWENEKLVYDVTPDSAIPEDTAEFANKFRFYTGAEDQLPDPALEALHGDDTPYYRGTAYLVFPQYDLTDFGETVPTYRVETFSEGEFITSQLYAFRTRPNTDRWFYMPIPEDWAGTWVEDYDLRSQIGYSLSSQDRLITYSAGTQPPTWTSGGGIWTDAIGPPVGGSGGRRWGWAMDGKIMIAGGVGSMLFSSNNSDSFSTLPSGPNSNAVAGLDTGRWVSFYLGSMRYSDDDGDTWSSNSATGLASSVGLSRWSDGVTIMFGGSTSIPYTPKIVKTNNGTSVTTETLPTFATATSITCLREHGGVWVAGTDSGEIAYRDVGGVWHMAAGSLGVQAQEVTHNGTEFVMIGGNSTSGETTGFIKSSVDGNTWTTRITTAISHPDAWVSITTLDVTQASGSKVALSSIVAAIHDREGHESGDYDVSELAELVDGVVIESTVTGAEAINSIIGSHFADPSDYDGQIHYIKRGKAVQLTLTEDDLIDEPETAQRNNSIEYPKKVHFLGQRADLAYASSKATSSRYSSDAQVVGEVTVGSPETFNDGTAPAEIAVKLHKVLWEEAIGEQELTIPDNFLGLVPTDCVGFAYRDQLNRYRILSIEDTPGQRKLRMIKDRQSAYTANLTEIPNPPPVTPPQSSVVAPTVMAVIDSSALTDNADTLHYLVALSGANDNWAGAVLQQQLGGSFSSIDSTTLNSIMGAVQNTVTDASPYYTDTTNEVVVRLFTDDQLESRTEAEFLTNGGAFFLSYESSGETAWEIMQFRDAVQDSNGDWVLSHLMRGRKNTPTNEHVPGALFVWIDPAILREPAQSSWINTGLIHRAVSNAQSPELADIQTNEYVGNSQREWPVADLLLTRPTGTSVEAEAIPRHRFGSSMNPIRSINWDGYQWSVTDGSNVINRTGTSATEGFDTTGWASPVTVTVAQLNRITGAGPAVSEDIV